MRMIDGDALIEKFNEKVDMAECLVDARTAERFATFCALADAVEEMPTVDAEVVVHCKDCKHSTLPSELTQRYGVPGTLTCHNRYSPCNRRNVGGNDFCSYGERKDDIEN